MDPQQGVDHAADARGGGGRLVFHLTVNIALAVERRAELEQRGGISAGDDQRRIWALIMV